MTARLTKPPRNWACTWWALRRRRGSAAGCRRRHRDGSRGDLPDPRAKVRSHAARGADTQGARGARADGRGRTNPAIARRMVITSKAVSKHIAGIFAKLG